MSYTKIPMYPRNGWQGYHLVDENNICVAKTCSRCRKEHPSSEFYKATEGRYKLSSRCRSCCKEHAAQWHGTVQESGKTNRQVRHEIVDTRNKSRSAKQTLEDQIRLRPDGTKICPSCKNTMPLSEYQVSRSTADGLQSRCRRCASAKDKARYYSVEEDGTDTVGTIKRKKRSIIKSSRSEEEILANRQRLRPNGVKTCSSCRRELGFEMFYREARNEDGLKYKCKPCAIASAGRKKHKKFVKYWDSVGIPIECYVCAKPWAPGDPADHVIPKSLGGVDDNINRLPMCIPHNTSKWMIPLELWLSDCMPDRGAEILERVSSLGVNYTVPAHLLIGAVGGGRIATLGRFMVDSAETTVEETE